MRAASNSANTGRGQSGAAFLPPLRVGHVVELRCGAQQVAGVWADVWVRQGDPWLVFELANQAAEGLRRDGATVRVRPVLL